MATGVLNAGLIPAQAELGSFARVASHLLAEHPTPALGARTIKRRAGQGLQHLDHRDYVPGDEVRRILEREIGPLVAETSADPGQPANDYRWVDGGRVGFINAVTRPFCDRCDRLRLTADGQLRNCLFSTVEWDARALLRSAAADAALAALIRDCVAAKRAGHGIDTPAFARPARAMYQIGG